MLYLERKALLSCFILKVSKMLQQYYKTIYVFNDNSHSKSPKKSWTTVGFAPTSNGNQVHCSTNWPTRPPWVEHNTHASKVRLKPKKSYPLLTWSAGGDFNFVAACANFVALYANSICNQCVKLKMIELTNTTVTQIHEKSWTILGAQ